MSSQPSPNAHAVARAPSPNIVEPEGLIERMEELHRAVAARAFELFAQRDGEPGRDLEDWLRAESEFVWPAPVEVIESDGKLCVRVEVPGFEANDLEVSVEPRRVMISGRRQEMAERATADSAVKETYVSQILRAVRLPSAVEPVGAAATLDDGILTIDLKPAEPAEPLAVPATT
jgi:HSP20 family protein